MFAIFIYKSNIYGPQKEKKPRKIDDWCEHLILFGQSWQNIDGTIQGLKVKLIQMPELTCLKFTCSLWIACLLTSHMIRLLERLGELAEGWKLILLDVPLSRWADFF